MEVLSERSAALCARCEAVVQSVLAAAPNAPRGLRSLAHALTGGMRRVPGDGDHERSRMLVALLFNSFVLPALVTAETYGMQIGGKTVSTIARQNLSAIAVSLEQLVGLVGLEAVDPGAGTAMENAKRYFTPHLISMGPFTAYSAALALVEAPPPSADAEAWPPPLTDGGGDAKLLEGDEVPAVATAGAVGAPAGSATGVSGGANGSGKTKAAGKQPISSPGKRPIASPGKRPMRSDSFEGAAQLAAIESSAAGGDTGADAAMGPGSAGVVVLEESCLLALVRFTHSHLAVELPLPHTLLEMLGSDHSDSTEAPAAEADMRSVLPMGARCWYTRGGGKTLATVLKVHHDDEPPYYTVEMEGAERSTVRSYLTPLTPAEDAIESAGAAAEGRQALEVQIAKVGPLGITLENGIPGSPPKLTVLIANGAAQRSGLLRVGDRISSINGHKVYDHQEAARIITSSDGVLKMIVLRAEDAALVERGFGAVGPVKAFYGASAPSAPPLRLWAFILPPSDQLPILGLSSSAAGSSSSLTDAAQNSAYAGEENCLDDFLTLRPSSVVWASSELQQPCIAVSAGVHVAAALSNGAWADAAHAECFRLAATSLSLEQMVQLLRAVRQRWVGRLRLRRRERCGAMLALGEAERASTALEARAKASLRRLHALVALSLVRSQLASHEGAQSASSGPVGGSSSGLLVGPLLDLTPISRPDGTSPTCFCHPPAMRVCRECTALRLRVEDATQAVASQLDREEADDAGTAPLQREASLRSLRTGAAWATQSVSSTGYEDARILHERLQGAAVQALLLEHAAAASVEQQQQPTASPEPTNAEAGASSSETPALASQGSSSSSMLVEPRVRSFTFQEDGPLGLTMRSHKGRAIVAQVSGQAFALDVPRNCMPLSLNGMPLNGPYRDVVAMLVSAPRPFVVDVQLSDSSMTQEEQASRVLADPLVLLSAGGQDQRFAQHCANLRDLLGPEEVGLGADVAKRCSPRAFDAAAELLASLPLLVGPQAKLRCMLRAWDCVLGVIGLCTDSPSADDFLPGMACALLRASPPMLISAVNSLVNFSAREDYEDMWVFHFVAAVGLVAQLSRPSSPPSARKAASADDAGLQEEAPAAEPGDGTTYLPDIGSTSVWTDYSDREPQPAEASAASAASARSRQLASSVINNRARAARALLQGLARPSRSSSSGASLLSPALHPSIASPPPGLAAPLAPTTPSPQTSRSSLSSQPSQPVASGASQPTSGAPEQIQAALSQLVEMGFERAVAERAITLGGDAEAALQLLLDGAVGTEDPSAAPEALSTDRQALLERKTVLQREIAEAMGKDAPSAHDSAAHSRRLDEYREITRRIDELPPLQSSSQDTSSGAAQPLAPAPGRVYQAACPRCQQANRFTLPDTPGQAAGQRKLSLQCLSCQQPFAIQI